MAVTNINIAFCFNNENEAKSLAAKLCAISPEIKSIISPTFDGFLKEIAKTDKVDYFIIEDNYIQCQATDLIEKLKASQRYKKSLISVYTAQLRNLHDKFIDYKLNYIFDTETDAHSIYEGLVNSILKSQTPAIPKNFNVLAVDDDLEVLELISMSIDELGHEKVDLCKSFEEAKKLLLKKDFDLILLDWNLSDGSCMDIMDFIKNQPVSLRTKSALSVVITGRNSVDDIMALLQYGVKDTIIKPFDFGEFEDKISYAVEKHLKNRKG